MNGWIALLVILILIVAAVLSSKHSTKKHIENELVKKTGELIKEFGNVELQCVCFYTKEEEKKTLFFAIIFSKEALNMIQAKKSSFLRAEEEMK